MKKERHHKMRMLQAYFLYSILLRKCQCATVRLFFAPVNTRVDSTKWAAVSKLSLSPPTPRKERLWDSAFRGMENICDYLGRAACFARWHHAIMRTPFQIIRCTYGTRISLKMFLCTAVMRPKRLPCGPNPIKEIAIRRAEDYQSKIPRKNTLRKWWCGQSLAC